MLDPAHIDFVRHLVVMVGAAFLLCFLFTFLGFYFQGRKEEKARAQLRRNRR